MKAIRIYVDKLPDFADDQIECAYRGKPDTCMCGCSGEYYYTEKNREFAGTKRGYPIKDDEINDKQVKRIADMFRTSGSVENIDNYIFTLIRNDVQYTIYFIEPFKEKVVI